MIRKKYPYYNFLLTPVLLIYFYYQNKDFTFLTGLILFFLIVELYSNYNGGGNFYIENGFIFKKNSKHFIKSYTCNKEWFGKRILTLKITTSDKIFKLNDSNCSNKKEILSYLEINNYKKDN